MAASHDSRMCSDYHTQTCIPSIQDVNPISPLANPCMSNHHKTTQHTTYIQHGEPDQPLLCQCATRPLNMNIYIQHGCLANPCMSMHHKTTQLSTYIQHGCLANPCMSITPQDHSTHTYIQHACLANPCMSMCHKTAQLSIYIQHGCLAKPCMSITPQDHSIQHIYPTWRT